MLLTGFAIAPLPAAAAVDVVFQDGFERGFQVLTPEIVVAPGEESTYCYYFLAPDNGPLGVRRWSSKMGAGMHHLILYASYDGTWAPKEVQPPGTLTQVSCGLGEGGTFPGWMYAAHNPTEDLVLPADDGSGTPLAIELAAGQPMFLQMFILNATDMPISTSASLKAEALGDGESYVKTASYFTSNTNIAIPPNSAGTQVQGTCAVPPGVKFWWFSTRTHLYATEAKISDIGADIIVNTDWEHPAAQTYSAPFHTFATGPGAGLTYRCTYTNPTNRTVTTGDSEATDEVCHAIGFFFPAEHPAICLNSFGPF